jgi:2-(1,2-epoxy-1,2-dihydrophenyl)acetyl-CoA isomerase
VSDLLETREGDVVRLTLNRPDRLNALSDAMTHGLRDSLSRIAGDASVGAVLLTGAGRGFCAGGDVQAMSSGKSASDLRANAEITRLLAEMPQPSIAAVNGAAAGAGLALALSCDLRLAGASARFGTAFLRLGLVSDMGAAFFLRDLMGAPKAKELFLLPDMLDAQAAVDLGLVNRLVPDELLQQEAMALAQRLAAGPRAAQAALKRLLASTAPLALWLDQEAQAQAACVASADHREAVSAFIAKRPPAFGRR